MLNVFYQGVVWHWKVTSSMLPHDHVVDTGDFLYFLFDVFENVHLCHVQTEHKHKVLLLVD